MVRASTLGGWLIRLNYSVQFIRYIPYLGVQDLIDKTWKYVN